jgi:hypothetical protein
VLANAVARTLKHALGADSNADSHGVSPRANAPVRWQPARVFGGALFRRSSGADTPPFIINQLKLSVYHETGEVAVRSGILRNILVECNVFGHLGARRKVGLFMLSSCSSLAMLQSSSSSCACSCSATCTPINSGGSHHSMVSGIERKHPAQQAQHPCPHPRPGDANTYSRSSCTDQPTELLNNVSY